MKKIKILLLAISVIASLHFLFQGNNHSLLFAADDSTRGLLSQHFSALKLSSSKLEIRLADYCNEHKNYASAIEHWRAAIAWQPENREQFLAFIQEASKKESEPFFAGDIQDAYYEIMHSDTQTLAQQWIDVAQSLHKAKFEYRALLSVRQALALQSEHKDALALQAKWSDNLKDLDPSLSAFFAAAMQTPTELPGTGLRLKCHVQLPSDFDPRQLYPMIFHFHGAGDSSQIAASYFFPVREEAGVITVSASFSWSAAPTTKGFKDDENEMLKLYDFLLTHLPVDPDKIIFSAHSMGGGMWSAFFNRHNNLATGWLAINAHTGDVRVRKQKKKNDTPILIIEGSKDPGKGVGKNVIQRLVAAGYSHTQYEVPDGVGHNDLDKTYFLILPWIRTYLANPLYPFE